MYDKKWIKTMEIYCLILTKKNGAVISERNKTKFLKQEKPVNQYR